MPVPSRTGWGGRTRGRRQVGPLQWGCSQVPPGRAHVPPLRSLRQGSRRPARRAVSTHRPGGEAEAGAAGSGPQEEMPEAPGAGASGPGGPQGGGPQDGGLRAGRASPAAPPGTAPHTLRRHRPRSFRGHLGSRQAVVVPRSCHFLSPMQTRTPILKSSTCGPTAPPSRWWWRKTAPG